MGLRKNLIYFVICSGCKKEYIRQTQTMLKERLISYRQYFRQITANGYRELYKDIWWWKSQSYAVFLQFRETTKS